MRRICIFCGSAPGSSEQYSEDARLAGRAIAERGYGLVYGGAHVGTMGAAADGALEAGGQVIGVMPSKLMSKELAHQGLSELIEVDSMHARKSMMVHLSDAFLVLPGGFGTLDEMFESLTWHQIGYHRKPLGLWGSHGFWKYLLQHLDHSVQEGFLHPQNRALVLTANGLEALLDKLSERMGSAPARALVKP